MNPNIQLTNIPPAGQCIYTRCYCEENIYQLGKNIINNTNNTNNDPNINEQNELKYELYVVFMSNTSKLVTNKHNKRIEIHLC
jgi:hypothetical protein